MATQAALLKAAKQVIAHAKLKRKAVKKPLRASRITKKAPTKRLIKRRKANTVEGYYPNPADVAKAFNFHDLRYIVQEQGKTASLWIYTAAFALKADAISYANAHAKKYGITTRIMQQD